MPELPEVETVVRTLEKQIRGATIREVQVLYKGICASGDPEGFSAALKGECFEEFDRRGKFLIFRLREHVLVAHMRMEGKFFVYPLAQLPDKHTHLILKLDQGELHYNDVRKFGRFWLYRRNEPLDCLNILGPEPWDEKLSGAYLKKYCRHSRTPLKTALLDQGMIAGIGNIYADEILYACRIHPERRGDSLSEEEISLLIKNTRKILRKAIKAGGTTIRTYTSSLGVTGRFQMSLRAHDQKICPRCKGPIRKITVGSRGTYYCPKCQKEDL